MDELTMFRQAIRGFDKEDVIAYIRKQEEEHGRQIISMERDIRKRDKVISELKSRLVLKDEQVEHMEQEIKDKYQKYIDHYNQIGDLIYLSRVQGDRIIAEAKEEADRIVAAAEEEAKKRIGSVQGQIDAKLKDGKEKYIAVQEEMNDIVEMLNQMQRKFMQSYKEMHEIVQNMPASLDDISLGEDSSEADEERVLNFGRDRLIDEMDLDDGDLDSLLDFDLDDEDEMEDLLLDPGRRVLNFREPEAEEETAAEPEEKQAGEPEEVSESPEEEPAEEEPKKPAEIPQQSETAVTEKSAGLTDFFDAVDEGCVEQEDSED